MKTWTCSLIWLSFLFIVSCDRTPTSQNSELESADTLTILKKSIAAFDTLLGEKQVQQEFKLVKNKSILQDYKFDVHGKPVKYITEKDLVALINDRVNPPAFVLRADIVKSTSPRSFVIDLWCGPSGIGCTFFWIKNDKGEWVIEKSDPYRS